MGECVMKRVKRFLKNNHWAILGVLGIATWIGMFAWIFYGACNVISFYVNCANL